MTVFDPIRGEEPSLEPPRGGYAKVDSIEPYVPDPADDWLLRMDVVDESDWHALPPGLTPLEARNRLKTYVLETEASQTGDRLRDLIQSLQESVERPYGAEAGRWWHLRFEPTSSRPQVQLFPNVFGDPLRLKLSDARPVDSGMSRRLDATCGMDHLPDSSTAAIERALEQVAQGITGVGVIDVGQGSAAALLRDGVPVAYFDLGGGITTNRRTWPEDLRGLCLTANPVVILSHWDMDHWAGHRRCRPFDTSRGAYDGQTWIVPRNPPGDRIGHSHAKFLDELAHEGANVLVWPDGLTELRAGRVTVVKCDGHDRNNSGLAVLVDGRGTGHAVVLPGDARLVHVPGVRDPVRAIVAPHHGARIEGDPITDDIMERAEFVVASYGARNTYGHPHPRQARLWRHSEWRATADRSAPPGDRLGNVLIDIDGWSHTYPPCGRQGCSLEFRSVIRLGDPAHAAIRMFEAIARIAVATMKRTLLYSG